MGMFTVLRTLVGVLPGSVADHVGMLVPGGCHGFILSFVAVDIAWNRTSMRMVLCMLAGCFQVWPAMRACSGAR
mgnify:CR=1 FL=1